MLRYLRTVYILLCQMNGIYVASPKVLMKLHAFCDDLPEGTIVQYSLVSEMFGSTRL